MNDFNAAIRLDPKEPVVYLNRAKLYERANQPDKSIADFTTVLKLKPTATTYAMRGTVHQKAKKYAKASEDYRAALKLNPKELIALNSFAWLQATCPNSDFRDGKSAVDHATSACQLTQWRVHGYVSTLAAAYAEAGNFQKAVTLAEQIEDEHLESFRAGKPVPSALKVLWETNVDDAAPPMPLSQWVENENYAITGPVVAEGMAALAVPESHRVCAYDAETGEPKWTFIAGGRIDLPPTIFRGLCLFGSRDGFAYAVRADDGKLVWRVRAAPQERRIVVNGQIESEWPLRGSIVASGDSAYVCAGRHPYAEGGITIRAIDVPSGKVNWTKGLNASTLEFTIGHHGRIIPKDGGFAPSRSSGAYYPLPLSGFLTMDGEWVGMDPWWLNAKSGDLKFTDPATRNAAAVVGQQSVKELLPIWPRPDPTSRLSRLRGQLVVTDGRDRIEALETESGLQLSRSGAKAWNVLIANQYLRGLLWAGGRVYVATENEGAKSGALWTFSAEGGNRVGEWKLDVAPTFEGMAAAGERLYLTTQDGRLHCLGARAVTPAQLPESGDF